jgi:hypothetical protein
VLCAPAALTLGRDRKKLHVMPARQFLLLRMHSKERAHLSRGSPVVAWNACSAVHLGCAPLHSASVYQHRTNAASSCNELATAQAGGQCRHLGVLKWLHRSARAYDRSWALLVYATVYMHAAFEMGGTAGE